MHRQLPSLFLRHVSGTRGKETRVGKHSALRVSSVSTLNSWCSPPSSAVAKRTALLPLQTPSSCLSPGSRPSLGFLFKARGEAPGTSAPNLFSSRLVLLPSHTFRSQTRHREVCPCTSESGRNEETNPSWGVERLCRAPSCPEGCRMQALPST